EPQVGAPVGEEGGRIGRVGGGHGVVRHGSTKPSRPIHGNVHIHGGAAAPTAGRTAAPTTGRLVGSMVGPAVRPTGAPTAGPPARRGAAAGPPAARTARSV